MKWLMTEKAPCGRFVHDVAMVAFLAEYNYLALPMVEFTLHGESNVRPDIVYCIGAEQRAMSRGENITVALELKGTLQDLRASNNIFSYEGWTDYLYLGVTRDLLEEAKKKVGNAPSIGIVCVNDGAIHKYAVRQRPSAERALQVYKQIVYNYLINNK